LARYLLLLSLVANGTPLDVKQLLSRISELEKKLVRVEAEITYLKLEITRKDKTIAGLQQRLFGSSSEKVDPNQLQLALDQLHLGKPAPHQEATAAEAPKTPGPRIRRTKAVRCNGFLDQIWFNFGLGFPFLTRPDMEKPPRAVHSFTAVRPWNIPELKWKSLEMEVDDFEFTDTFDTWINS
jgi:Transposase C of IS166 homeodomain